MSSRPESATVQIKLRMKEPLREQIAQAAEARGVSMNTEMVDRLERSLRDDASATSMTGLLSGMDDEDALLLTQIRLATKNAKNPDGLDWKHNLEDFKALASWLIFSLWMQVDYPNRNPVEGDIMNATGHLGGPDSARRVLDAINSWHARQPVNRLILLAENLSENQLTDVE